MFVLSIVASTGRVGNVLVALRCVEIRDMAISMAFQVLEKSCHSGFFCIESGSGRKMVYFCVCFWLQKRTTAWRPPVYPLLGFYSIFNYTIHFNTWMVTHPSLTLQRQRVTLLYLRLFLSASLFCTDISVSLIQESPVFQLFVAKNRISLSSLQPILGPFFGKSCSGSLLKKRKH